MAIAETRGQRLEHRLSHTFYTNGIGELGRPGVINGRGSTPSSSQWQTLPDPGFDLRFAYAVGFVFTAHDVCGFAPAAPWT